MELVVQTGSSKEQRRNFYSYDDSVKFRKNAVEERKIQRLFRNPEVTKIGLKIQRFRVQVEFLLQLAEIADSLEINLDVLPLKYEGFKRNGTRYF